MLQNIMYYKPEFTAFFPTMYANSLTYPEHPRGVFGYPNVEFSADFPPQWIPNQLQNSAEDIIQHSVDFPVEEKSATEGEPDGLPQDDLEVGIQPKEDPAEQNQPNAEPEPEMTFSNFSIDFILSHECSSKKNKLFIENIPNNPTSLPLSPSSSISSSPPLDINNIVSSSSPNLHFEPISPPSTPGARTASFHPIFPTHPREAHFFPESFPSGTHKMKACNSREAAFPTPYSRIPFVLRPKRPRTIFSTHQMEKLEEAFRNSEYLAGEPRIYLARQLGLTENQVKIWFQNRRIKQRKLAVEQDKSDPE